MTKVIATSQVYLAIVVACIQYIYIYQVNVL